MTPEEFERLKKIAEEHNKKYAMSRQPLPPELVREWNRREWFIRYSQFAKPSNRLSYILRNYGA